MSSFGTSIEPCSVVDGADLISRSFTASELGALEELALVEDGAIVEEILRCSADGMILERDLVVGGGVDESRVAERVGVTRPVELVVVEGDAGRPPPKVRPRIGLRLKRLVRLSEAER